LSTLSPPPSTDTTLWNPSKRKQTVYYDNDYSKKSNITSFIANIRDILQKLPKEINNSFIDVMKGSSNPYKKSGY
jgi:hypothetical protein